MKLSISSASALLLLSLAGCAGVHRDDARDGERPRDLYEDLGSWRRAATAEREAQRYFDQGLVLAFAFNHDEARRSFARAAELDPTCAMAWWGMALVDGPHINNPAVDAEHARRAWTNVQKARELQIALEASGKARTVDSALIHALTQRYAADPNAARGPLDQAYAAAMRSVWRAHPDDADVGTLFAEALMDLHPWDLWTHDGQAKTDTEEIVATLERVLEIAPTHPGANHLYIHAVEASPHPRKAKAAADRLRRLVPDAGHLVHMPAHIDLRLGDYALASEANERAIAADARHAERFPRAGFYRVYMAHNHHFLALAEMMQGNSEKALAAAQAMVDGVPAEFLSTAASVVDGLYPVVLHVLVRFGRWEEILRHPQFDPALLVSNAVRHYARGVALTALDRLDEAEEERLAFERVLASMDDRAIGNNPAKRVLEIPRNLLAGELLFRKGERERGLEHLREAVAIEDTLVYDEPPDWMMPARHPLGAALLADRRFDEAERVFREDLERFPENGWGLDGLRRALEGRTLAKEAGEVARRLRGAWARADVELRSPCFCQVL